MPLLRREPCVYPNDLFAENRAVVATTGEWWVLHVRPRMEKVLARRLHACRTPFFLPLYERQWVQRGRRQRSHLPLFPGYVFLFGDAEARLAAITTNMVAQAITVSDQERLWTDLRRIEQVMNSDRPLEPADLLQPGSPVVVSHGPLAGLTGHVLQRTRPWKLIVEVRFLQRGVAVELEDWMLDSADLRARASVGRGLLGLGHLASAGLLNDHDAREVIATHQHGVRTVLTQETTPMLDTLKTAPEARTRTPQPMPASQETPANNVVVPAKPMQEVRRHATRVLVVLALAGVLVWAYWPVLLELVSAWSTDPMYSHGYLVPLFALGLLWFKRATMPAWSELVSWLGATLVVVGAAIHLLAAWLFIDILAGAGMIISVAGLVALLGGWRLLRWAAPAVAFLAFMLPLPHSVAHALGHPLQRIATKASTYVLQTLGFPAVSEGNVILVNDLRIGVVEACSGLSMLVVFFALSTGMALVIRRPWWERVLLVLSAVPIALLANLGRIVLTTLAYDLVGGETADVIFHDLAGWLMMPFALFLMLLELQILRRLVIEEQRVVATPAPAGGTRAGKRSERGRPRGRSQ